jgi:hypothetical protein
VQLALNFHLLKHGNPMKKYTTMQNVFVHLNVFDNPMKHWFDGFGWETANCMCEQVLKIIQTIMVKASFFLSLSWNEVSNIDNQS